MLSLKAALAKLPERHRVALRWFTQHAGIDIPWPDPLPDGTLLATRAKGIYKPTWTEYALSVRSSVKGPYQDGATEPRPDGTWSFRYFQENTDPRARDRHYTNRGLLRCQGDEVPLGVLRQVSGRPNPRYRVLGLALVDGWQEGFFRLEGFSPAGEAHSYASSKQIHSLIAAQEAAMAGTSTFAPDDLVDARERLAGSIIRRRGQPEFRGKLLEAYGRRCAVTGYDVEEALEACHIIPYRGPETDHLTNGLLLRADLHTLFDLGLIAVDPETARVLVAAKLRGTAYEFLAAAVLRSPTDTALKPSREALEHHRRQAGV